MLQRHTKHIRFGWTRHYIGIFISKRGASEKEKASFQQIQNMGARAPSALVPLSLIEKCSSALFNRIIVESKILRRYVLIDAVFLIAVPPSVTSALPKEVVAIEGKSSTMQCTFQARPRPTVSWKLNGNTLVNGSRVRVVSRVIGFQNNMTIVLSTLTIHNVIEADSGNISCSADIPLKDLSTTTQHLVWCKSLFQLNPAKLILNLLSRFAKTNREK